ncbi:MAG: hypothetical protein AB4368_32500 [Xenococcaceae cyanobacterium]
MNDPNDHISEDVGTEIIAEATRLHSEASQGYSFAELQQICKDAQIPPHIFRQAVKNVEAKRLREQQKRRQLQEDHKYIQKQVKKGISVGIALLIPAIAVSSLFIFRSQFEPLLASVVSRFTKAIEKPEVVREPEVIFREDFRNRVVGKTKEEVIQAVGKPRSTNDFSIGVNDYSIWRYKNIKDRFSGRVGSASVTFEDGIVDRVTFSSY